MNDTVKLMKEACQGCKYAAESIKIARGYAKNRELGLILDNYTKDHELLQSRLSKKIKERGADEYSHPKMGAAMTKLHTNVSLTMNPSPSNIAKLMINGCNMGIKTLSKKRNESRFADKEARALINELIATEQQMASELLRFL
jgi:hypothetical protein